MTNFIYFCTTPTKEEAIKIAKYLVDKKIVACVNILENIISIYHWKDNIEEGNEFLLIIKTTEEKSKLLIQTIEEIHSYDTPECIGIKIENGSQKYLKWLEDVLK